MLLDDITPLVLTYNEAPNIERCLEPLGWAARVVVVDSFSSDDTLSRAARFGNTKSFQRAFDNHSAQWSYGLCETGITTPWVLSLDADYGVTPEFVQELRGMQPDPNISAYEAPFVYCIFGRRLRGTVYKPVAVLFRREQCAYIQDGHTQRLQIRQGTTGRLRSPILHDDRKSLARWLDSQSRYMDLEASKLLSCPPEELGLADRLRKLYIVAPPVMLVYCLLVQQGLLDGWAGWYYALQRMTAETILSLKLLQARLTSPSAAQPIPTTPAAVASRQSD
jgi:glycosyltransferase involved in cell wall biosynthesis